TICHTANLLYRHYSLTGGLSMKLTRCLIVLFCAASVFAILSAPSSAQQYATNLYQSLRWRCIGPFRAGRTVGAVGIPNQPNVFFMGVKNAVVWKRPEYGRNGTHIFDDQPTGSVGDIALCESQPNVMYVGCGEGLQRP